MKKVAKGPVLAAPGKLMNAMPRIGAMIIALLLPFAAAAEPIELKLSFYTSAQTDTYQYVVKPFVDGVNAEASGLLAIKVFPDGALGKALADQPRFVLDGTADIAFIVPGQTPYRFPDNAVLEMPGLFRDAMEGTLAYTGLVAAKALHGYQDYFVIGAYMSEPTIIHSRKPIGSLAALKGQKIRANNLVQAEALERLGASPSIMPSARVANAISSGAIDGAAICPVGLFQYGIAPVVTNHYLLAVGAAPSALVMNRKTFDGLPEAAKAIIRKYSGEAAAATWITLYGAAVKRSLDEIKSDPNRKVTEPSVADRETARRIYRSMIEAWAAKSAGNRALLTMTEADLATIRSSK